MNKAAKFVEEYEAIKKDLKKKLDKNRYIHCEGVSMTAAALAMRYDYDIKRAMLSGILHDCAKQYSEKKLINLCKKYKLEITDAEISNPSLLHAKVGSKIAKVKYNVTDQDILNSITFHTTGRPEMTILEKIIYVADYIEPFRKEIPTLNEIRKAAFEDLDKAVILEAEATIEHLKNKKIAIDDMTLNTMVYYKNLINN